MSRACTRSEWRGAGRIAVCSYVRAVRGDRLARLFQHAHILPDHLLVAERRPAESERSHEKETAVCAGEARARESADAAGGLAHHPCVLLSLKNCAMVRPTGATKSGLPVTES